MAKRIRIIIYVGCVGLTLFSLMSCLTTMDSGGKIFVANGKEISVANGSYVASRALVCVEKPLLMLLGKIFNYDGKKWAVAGEKPVAIRVNNGKAVELLAVQQGQGETRTTYATATRYYSVNLIVIDSLSDLDKCADFNEAKSMLH